jgi:L-alanine-DL-glutamate epimerase-like enolase superfamily enzyme
VPNSRWLEYIPQLDMVTASGMRVEDGRAIPSDQPGLGIDWDWDKLDHYQVHRAEHR